MEALDAIHIPGQKLVTSLMSVRSRNAQKHCQTGYRDIRLYSPYRSNILFVKMQNYLRTTDVRHEQMCIHPVTRFRSQESSYSSDFNRKLHIAKIIKGKQRSSTLMSQIERGQCFKKCVKGLNSFKTQTMHTKQGFKFDWNEHNLLRPMTAVTTIKILAPWSWIA